MDDSRIITIVRNPIVSATASALAGGAWALVPVGRARGLAKVALVALPAAVAAAAIASGQRTRTATKRGPLSAGAAFPAVAGGTVAFTHWVALGADRGLENFLVRRGVRRPRLVMAAASAVLTPLVVTLNRSADEDQDSRAPRISP